MASVYRAPQPCSPGPPIHGMGNDRRYRPAIRPAVLSPIAEVPPVRSGRLPVLCRQVAKDLPIPVDNSPSVQRFRPTVWRGIHASGLAERLSSLETAAAGDFTQRPRELFRRSPENDR